jgi:RND family efflux transporter MFP subunit
MNPLKLRSSVQERYASLIRPGLPVRFAVESFPGETFEGKVAFVSPAVDQATRTFPVEVLVDNSGRRLKPGFFAKGVIQTRVDDNVLGVPEVAISTLAGVSTVYIIDGGKVRQQIVTLGSRDGKVVEIVDGLNGNEVLASSNLNMLATGVTVEVAEAGRGAPGRERSPEVPQDQGARP